jgi:hypothetical protein
MVYHNQNYWVFWTFSTVWYFTDQKIRRFGNCICFRPRVRGKTPTQLGPVERGDLGPVIEVSFL